MFTQMLVRVTDFVVLLSTPISPPGDTETSISAEPWIELSLKPFHVRGSAPVISLTEKANFLLLAPEIW